MDFTFSSFYAFEQTRISSKVDFIYTFWNTVKQFQVSHLKTVFLPSHLEYRHQFSVVCLICFLHLISGTKHKGYLGSSSKSTVYPDFTDQDMILGMMLRFTCSMDASLPVYIFTILPVHVNSCRLFYWIMK